MYRIKISDSVVRYLHADTVMEDMRRLVAALKATQPDIRNDEVAALVANLLADIAGKYPEVEGVVG